MSKSRKDLCTADRSGCACKLVLRGVKDEDKGCIARQGVGGGVHLRLKSTRAVGGSYGGQELKPALLHSQCNPVGNRCLQQRPNSPVAAVDCIVHSAPAVPANGA